MANHRTVTEEHAARAHRAERPAAPFVRQIAIRFESDGMVIESGTGALVEPDADATPSGLELA